MFRSLAWAFLSALACVGSVSASEAPKANTPPALEAYGRLPTLEQVAISPNGKLIALILSENEVHQLQVREADSLKPIATGRVGSLKVRSLDWAGDDFLLVTISTAAWIPGLTGPTREYAQAEVFDVQNGRHHPLMEVPEGALNTLQSIAGIRMINGKPVVFAEGVSFPGEQGVLTLYRADLKDRAFRQVQAGDESTEDWVIDDQGRPIARSEYYAGDGRYRVLLNVDGRSKTWEGDKGLIEHPELLGLGRDGRSVAVKTFDGDGYSVHELSADGVMSKELPGDMRALIFDPATHVLLGGSRTGEEKTEANFFSPNDQAVWRAVTNAFKGEDVSLESWSNDRKRWVVLVAGPEHGFAYYIVDLNTGKASPLGDVYAGIPPEQVATVKLIHYKAADGLEIPAYLTLPKGRDPHALPLIVMPHGGPAARDEPGFDWWAQALSSLGYAVLQPQFRGSGGFDYARLAAGFGEWGRKMQTDLSDGVRALAKDGVIDSKRVCIVGASYGGYAALAGVTLESGVYRCAVSVAGVSDLRRFLAEEREMSDGDKTTLRYWNRFLGVSSPSDPKLDAISPARLADRVQAPVLLIHGKDDTVVRIDQSIIMRDALQRAGKPVELVLLKDEDHWLSRSATRLQMLQSTARFLAANNPP